MRVQTKPGAVMPFEKDPRKHHSSPFEMPDTAYYRRAKLRGDLVLATPKKSVSK